MHFLPFLPPIYFTYIYRCRLFSYVFCILYLLGFQQVASTYCHNRGKVGRHTLSTLIDSIDFVACPINEQIENKEN